MRNPDDLHLNFRTSEVTFIGPLTKEGKAQWDRLHDLLEQADRELETMTAQLKKTRSRINRASLEHEIFELGRVRELLVERIWRAEPAEEDDGANIDGGIRSLQPRRAVRAGATRSRTPPKEKMRDLLVPDLNIVQSEDLGGSNPLCSTRKSTRPSLRKGCCRIRPISRTSQRAGSVRPPGRLDAGRKRSAIASWWPVPSRLARSPQR
jgi:hypothetical protein